VFVRYPDSVRGDVDAIRGLLVDTPSGARVPLGQVARVSVSERPNVVWREGGRRRVSVDASIEGRDLSSVVADIRKDLKALKVPADYQVVFGGQHQNQQRALRALAAASIIVLPAAYLMVERSARQRRHEADAG
jgi:Cu/Ag efflux pump CusA